MTAPRDWDKEMAEIDKVIAKAPAPAQVPAKAGAVVRHQRLGSRALPRPRRPPRGRPRSAPG